MEGDRAAVYCDVLCLRWYFLRFHTLTYVLNSGRLYGFGKGGSGQLALNNRDNQRHPVPCQTMQELDGKLHEVFAGGDQSFAVMNGSVTSVDFRLQRPLLSSPAWTIPVVERLEFSLGQLVDEESLLDDSLQQQLETLCLSLSSWNGAFLGPDDEHYYYGSKNPGVDLIEADKALIRLSKVMKTVTKNRFIRQFSTLLRTTKV